MISLVYFSLFDMSVRPVCSTSSKECSDRTPCLFTKVTIRASDDSNTSLRSKNTTCTVRLLSLNKMA